MCEDISMDFATCLLKSQDITIIFLVVRRLSKHYHLGPLNTHFISWKVATLFLLMVKLHGFSRTIVSDKDFVFISLFWKELFRLRGTRLTLSNVYHSQSNGQMEVLNCFVQLY